MAYTRRSGGGSFKGRTAPSDTRVTEKEKRIIDFLEKQRQQSKEVASDFIKGTEGVMGNEADNRQTLQNLKTDLWKAKVDNVKKRQQTEVKYYEGLAKQAGEDSEYWGYFSKTMSQEIASFAEGAIHTVQFLRDRHVDNQNKKKEQQEKDREGEFSTDQCGRDYDDPYYGQPCDVEEPEEYPDPDPIPEPDPVPPIEPTGDQLLGKAFNSTIGESNKEQSRLHAEGDFKSADVLAEQVYGKAAGTKWWGIYYARKKTANFEEEWPSIVSLASEGHDPSVLDEDAISESFYNYMRHKGVALNSVVGREVSKRFRKKLTALSTNRLQQSLVQRDDARSQDIINSVIAHVKHGDSTSLDGVVAQWVLHESRAHKMIGGKYSSPESRILNYGQTFDSIVGTMLKAYPWSSWEEFDSKILSLPVIADKSNYHLPVDHPKYEKRPIWRDQRAHMIDTYKDLFVQNQTKEIKRIRGLEESKIRSRIAELTIRTTDPTSTDAEGNSDYINVKTEEGRKELYALLNSAESEDEKKFIGDKLSYDPKSQVALTTHEQMLRALEAGDYTEFQWFYNNLDDFQKKYYESLAEFTSRQELLKANWKYEDTENHVETKVKSLLTENWSIDSNYESYEKAKKWGIQRFYDINETIDTEKFSNPKSRIDEVKRLLNEDLNDPNGLFKVAQVGNRREFVHFVDNYEYDEPGMYEERARIILDRFDQKTPTLDEINQLDLIPEKDAINIMKDIVTGSDGIRLPKILWDVHKKTGYPLVDIVNGQLTRESISTKYNYKATEKDLVKATQVEYLEQKAPKEIAKTTSPQNISAVSGWYDVRNWIKTATDIGPQKVYQGTALNVLNQFSILLPKNLQKYNENLGNQSSLMDDLEVPYEIVEGRTRFSDPELAIRRGQVEGLVYNPFTDTMMEVA